jgi:hypothetical protein
MVLQFLYNYYPSLRTENHIFASDRDKGISEGVLTAFPNAYASHCCQHIADNIQSKYGLTAQNQFWKVARARTEKLYLEALAELLPTAATYLATIPAKRWARHAFPYPRYGHDTSNISESLNSVFRPIRCMPPIRMIDGIWTYVMETIHERRHRPQRGQLANTPLEHFEERMKQASRYRVYTSGGGIYQVQVLHGAKYIVDLTDGTCECGQFYEYQTACKHALIAIQHAKEDPYIYVFGAYKTETYRTTYSKQLMPISIQDLTPDLEVKPPIQVKQRGRPKTKRIRKGQYARKKRRCGNCGQLATHPQFKILSGSAM